MDTASLPKEGSQPKTQFLGLAPFLRVNISGVDLLPTAQDMLVQAEKNPTDPELWMNLSVAMQCIGQRDIGLAIQDQALALKRIFRLDAALQPARFRLLVLMVPGDIAANTPIDCLLEFSDVDLIFYYVSVNDPLDMTLPEHDAMMLGMSDSDENRTILKALEVALGRWPKPIINAPLNIPTTGRDTASRLLQDLPGLLMPPTLRASRPELEGVANEQELLSARFPGSTFPVIVRPLNSQAGRDLDRVYNPEELRVYLCKVDAAEFFISRFIDYSGEDGLFRKFRIALIDGRPYPCHMAVSANWMVHYVNAGMYEDAQKREEESLFMQNFEDFSERHKTALHAIRQRTKLDYVCIDCAETGDGRLLVFEVDHTMVVHAMDPDQLFPYKQFYMQQIIDAFRSYLARIVATRQLTH